MSGVEPSPTAAANWNALAAKANTAIANNITFLAIASPTDPQAIAQVQALTKQVNALIRIAIGALLVQDGT